MGGLWERALSLKMRPSSRCLRGGKVLNTNNMNDGAFCEAFGNGIGVKFIPIRTAFRLTNIISWLVMSHVFPSVMQMRKGLNGCAFIRCLSSNAVNMTFNLFSLSPRFNSVLQLATYQSSHGLPKAIPNLTGQWGRPYTYDVTPILNSSLTLLGTDAKVWNA